MPCSVEGCEKPILKRELCNAHYLRQWRHGDPLKGGVPRGPAREFLLQHVNYKGDECVIWPFSRTEKGYASLRYEGVTRVGHRLMCILAHGEPPTPEHEAAHSCGKGLHGCINPNHLSWKTRQENIDDKMRHGTQTQGEDCPFAKLTEDQARRAKHSGEKAATLAAEFGVRPITILRIRSGITWKGV